MSRRNTILRKMICTLLLIGGVLSAQTSVLTVKDGKVYKDGKEYRAFGMNVSFLSDEILRLGPKATDAFAIIEHLGKKKIPFIRTWFGYMTTWKPYFNDEEKYWQHLDLLVDACEKANVGLVVSLFWKMEELPYEFNEKRKDLLDPNSKCHKFMVGYIKKLITRYRDRSIIWMWEWANEVNYLFDLPHERKFKNRDDVFTSRRGVQLEKLFAAEVRKYDSVRPLSTGNGGVRNDLYNRSENPRNCWKKDSEKESFIAASWCCPKPYDVFSIHTYPRINGDKFEIEKFRGSIRRHLKLANYLKKPLFIGEFALLPQRVKGPKPKLDMKAYKKYTREIFELISSEKVPLAAWWEYAAVKSRRTTGTVNPDLGKYTWVIDMIAEYNEKIANDLKNK